MGRKNSDSDLVAKDFLPKMKLDHLLRPIHRFMEIEASGGIVLLLATLIALFLANTSLSQPYFNFWQQKLSVSVAEGSLEMSLVHFINDGLMTIFFFVMGLEIKREIRSGELRSLKKALLPILAAVGGMAVPALLYLSLAGRGPAMQGWAIPMATDIAFVVGFLSLLGRRVPHALKITLLTLAIADDIGAIIIIAVVYSKGIVTDYLAASLGFYGLVFVLNFLGVRRVTPYIILGVFMWYFLWRSGIHPTLAGVLLGLAAPSGRLVRAKDLKTFLSRFLKGLTDEAEDFDRESLRAVGRESISPLERLAVDLHPWVAFGIMPLFALANAGVSVQLTALESRTAWAVILGLVFGKPLGIYCISWIAQAFRLVTFPSGVSNLVFFAASCLAGVGFTMSIFIASLAMDGDLLASAKVGTFLGSALSACLGLYLLHRFLDRRELSDAEGG